MTPRLRILVSTPSFLPIVGGAELGIHELYTRLGRSHDVTVIAGTPRQDILDEYGATDYVSANYRMARVMPTLDRGGATIPMRILRRSSLPYLARLARMSRESAADVVNFHFVRPHGLALVVLRRLLGVPVVLSLVGRSDVLALLSRPQRLYARGVIASADEVVAISSYCLPDSGKGVVIPYGVDTVEFSPDRRRDDLRRALGAEPADLLLFTVQRLAPIKRVDMLLRVAARVIAEHPTALLVIGGRGEEESNLRSLAQDLGIEARVRFVGYIGSKRLPEYFASADLFIFHSLLETFGIVFAQAMSSGLPIIAASTSCVPDVVYPDNGVLVDPFDISAFANAINRFAVQRDFRATIGAHNRARALRELDWDIIAEAYERVLLTAAGR